MPSPEEKTRIYTIGHSNTSFDAFVENLKKHNIGTLVDVRSAPFSRYTPHFNYDTIEPLLEREGISYEFMGNLLGGRPNNQSYFSHDGKPDYDKMALDEGFHEGLNTLRRKAEREILCLMCSEEDPAKCHRSKLVSARLAEHELEVMHIRGDGSLESEQDNAKRRVPLSDKQLELF